MSTGNARGTVEPLGVVGGAAVLRDELDGAHTVLAGRSGIIRNPYG